MLEAEVDGRLVRAGPDSADVAQCPACGGGVSKRRRRRMDGHITFFYRHDAGEGEDCLLRYAPVSLER